MKWIIDTDGNHSLMLYDEDKPDTAVFLKVFNGTPDERIAFASRLAALLNTTEVLR